MSSNIKKKKKPLSVTLWAALIFAVITFFVGYIIPSVFMLDSRIVSKNDEIESLNQEIKDLKSEISSLEASIKEKDEANVLLGEKISEHLQTIEALNAKVSELESDVDFAAKVAMNQESPSENQITSSVSRLSSGQQLVILLGLFILLIFVISVTCGVIAAVKGTPDPAEKEAKKKKKKEKKEKKKKNAEPEETAKSENAEESKPEKAEESSEPPISEESVSEPKKAEEPQNPAASSDPLLDSVNSAIASLYEGKLEDGMEKLGGFKFGITNFDEVLSHKASGKSFGGSENGDFVAFMTEDGHKLYIIPRYMALSDSAVSLRGVTDLFEMADKNGNPVPRGTVKIKAVEKPAVFEFGDGGWAISSKGEIITE